MYLKMYFTRVKYMHNASALFSQMVIRSVYNIQHASLFFYIFPLFQFMVTNTFYVVQYLQKNFKIKRNPMVSGDNIIIRVNLIRHIIFRNPQVFLIKYLYHSQLGTKREGNVN